MSAIRRDLPFVARYSALSGRSTQVEDLHRLDMGALATIVQVSDAARLQLIVGPVVHLLALHRSAEPRSAHIHADAKQGVRANVGRQLDTGKLLLAAIDHLEFRELKASRTRLLDFHRVVVILTGCPKHPSDALAFDAGVELDTIIGERQRRPVHADTA